MRHAQWQIAIAHVNIVKCPLIDRAIVTVVFLSPSNAVSAVQCNFIICGNARIASNQSRFVIVCVPNINIQLLTCNSSEENYTKKHVTFAIRRILQGRCDAISKSPDADFCVVAGKYKIADHKGDVSNGRFT